MQRIVDREASVQPKRYLNAARPGMRNSADVSSKALGAIAGLFALFCAPPQALWDRAGPWNGAGSTRE
jgi:hypothetical protein